MLHMNDLGAEIYRDLIQYGGDVDVKIRAAAEKAQSEMLMSIPYSTPVRTGTMKKGWVKGTIKDDKKTGELIIGVRNKLRPTVVHLVSFSHDGYAHGKKFRVIIPRNFVKITSDYYQNELNKEIENILR